MVKQIYEIVNPQKNEKNHTTTKKWLMLSSTGIQMGVLIYLATWIGKKIDHFYALEKPWFTIGFSILALLISLYLLLNTIKKIDKFE